MGVSAHKGRTLGLNGLLVARVVSFLLGARKANALRVKAAHRSPIGEAFATTVTLGLDEEGVFVHFVSP